MSSAQEEHDVTSTEDVFLCEQNNDAESSFDPPKIIDSPAAALVVADEETTDLRNVTLELNISNVGEVSAEAKLDEKEVEHDKVSASTPTAVKTQPLITPTASTITTTLSATPSDINPKKPTPRKVADFWQPDNFDLTPFEEYAALAHSHPNCCGGCCANFCVNLCEPATLDYCSLHLPSCLYYCFTYGQPDRYRIPFEYLCRLPLVLLCCPLIVFCHENNRRCGKRPKDKNDRYCHKINYGPRSKDLYPPKLIADGTTESQKPQTCSESFYECCDDGCDCACDCD